ncbi:DUF3048 domain-containing protein [Lachnoclostridium sp. Marseille-P6806]|uniref:DUF3048 domain-containing protein n=1 Tax=Lachnoclostridium sp. Marseille-P6806 TaxID=2364793 RepID=UPI001F5F8EC4|nr:DUF3048 domain-containing protein [Lachnoclostridium sp. Marseille-P6806]
MKKARAAAILLAASLILTSACGNAESPARTDAEQAETTPADTSSAADTAPADSSDGERSPEDSTGGETASEDGTEASRSAEEDAESAPPRGITGSAAALKKDEYLSELTGEPIAKELCDQRPVAVMVDNESIALPHYGTAEADVVYELMNSTANNRITRLMCIVKDWKSIRQLGSIRSTRPTNILLAAEWNAVLCHDGGPYYNNQYFQRDWSAHFSGTFSRVDNGKKREYTEYVLAGDLEKNFGSNADQPKDRYSASYNSYAPWEDGESRSHFRFTEFGTHVNLPEYYGSALPAARIVLPFPHSKTELRYNTKTQLYDYYEYGKLHKDAEDGETLSFTNVILQCCSYNQLDSHGYLIYNCIDSAQPAFYLTGGYAKDLGWSKTSETGVTRFYDSSGEEVLMNTGKTYIALVPDDVWQELVME